VFQYLFPALNIEFIHYEKENTQYSLNQLQNIIDNCDEYIGDSNVLCSIFFERQFLMNKKELLENIKTRLNAFNY
jgi:hypothetical protein